MKRVLVFGVTENPGGVESFLMNYYRNIDRSRVQFEFLCNTHEQVAYEKEWKALGGRIYHITARRDDYRRYHQELEAFFRRTRGRFCAIWVNVSSLANIDYLKYAKKYGIPRRIIHSHNSRNMDSFLRGLVHRANKLAVGRYATDFWACSEAAAEWFYSGMPWRKRAVLIHNAIPLDRYAFSEEKRRTLREELGIGDAYVVGNIGRLHFQKNQELILDIAAVLAKKKTDFRFVLVGDGEDREKLKRKARELGVDDRIVWAGVQQDIGGWLSAMDLFLFPSRFEGLSVSALEAQANGIPFLASEEAVAASVRMNHNLFFEKLEAPAGAWAAKILQIRREEGGKRIAGEEIRKNFQQCGYDIRVEAEKLEQEFLKG